MDLLPRHLLRVEGNLCLEGTPVRLVEYQFQLTIGHSCPAQLALEFQAFVFVEVEAWGAEGLLNVRALLLKVGLSEAHLAQVRNLHEMAVG
jgi:hypothetical protein